MKFICGRENITRDDRSPDMICIIPWGAWRRGKARRRIDDSSVNSTEISYHLLLIITRIRTTKICKGFTITKKNGAALCLLLLLFRNPTFLFRICSTIIWRRVDSERMTKRVVGMLGIQNEATAVWRCEIFQISRFSGAHDQIRSNIRKDKTSEFTNSTVTIQIDQSAWNLFSSVHINGTARQ